MLWRRPVEHISNSRLKPDIRGMSGFPFLQHLMRKLPDYVLKKARWPAEANKLRPGCDGRGRLTSRLAPELVEVAVVLRTSIPPYLLMCAAFQELPTAMISAPSALRILLDRWAITLLVTRKPASQALGNSTQESPEDHDQAHKHGLGRRWSQTGGHAHQRIPRMGRGYGLSAQRTTMTRSRDPSTSLSA